MTRLLIRTFLALAVAASSLALTASPAAAAPTVFPPAVSTDTQTGTYANAATWDDAIDVLRDRFTVCQSEMHDNSGRNVGSWTTGAVYTLPTSINYERRDSTKTVTDGDCTIEYIHADWRTKGPPAGAWEFAIAQVTVTHTTTTPVLNPQTQFGDIVGDYAAGLATAASLLDFCNAEALRNGAINSGSWSIGSPYTTQGLTYRDFTKTETDGDCTIEYRRRQVDFQRDGSYIDDRLFITVTHVTAIPAGTWVTLSERANGRSYDALVTILAGRHTICQTEIAANADRSSGNWAYGNPRQGDYNSVRSITKTANDGMCQITYVIEEDFGGNTWTLDRLSISVREFDSPAPKPRDPEPGQGDKRHGCSPAFARSYPHLCLSVETEEQQTQCVGDAVDMAPCKGADITTRPDPGELGHEYANGSDSAVQRWIRQEAAKKALEGAHDQACAQNPGPCAPYPYEQWKRQGLY